MLYPIYQVDAFTSVLFKGNPAAVIPLEQWLPDHIMQSIAAENNLSETAFIIPEGDIFHIRWMTPVCEVDLCGHATLAAAWVLWNELGYQDPLLTFNSRSGLLHVSKNGDWLELDFPAQKPQQIDKLPQGMEEAIGSKILSVVKGTTDYLLELENEEAVKTLTPDFKSMSGVKARGIIITAPGSGNIDFVSRFFAPAFGIDEDPVTGSAHTLLVPYWAGKTGKKLFHALQVSKRGGELKCVLEGDRVKIAGQAKLFLKGTCYLPA